MERKWDINLVANPRNPQIDILHNALAEVGVTDAEQSSTIIDSILDWINPNETAGFNGAKSDYYLHLNPPYSCKNGFIDDISELLLIKGVTPEIYWGSNSTNHPVSAYQQHGGGTFDQATLNRSGAGFRNGDQPQYPVGLYDLFCAMGGPLNINTASLKTLQLIPGIDEAIAERILQQRQGPDGQDGTDDDAPFQPGEQIEGMPPALQGAASYGYRSYVFDVTVDAWINDYHRTFHGIVSRSGSSSQTLVCVKFYWD